MFKTAILRHPFPLRKKNENEKVFDTKIKSKLTPFTLKVKKRPIDFSKTLFGI